MENFKNRLLQFVEFCGLSQRGFEELCGLTQGTIASIKVKGPSVDVLMKISNAYPDLNLNWLIGGRGQMLVTNEQPIHQTDIHHNQQVTINNWDGLAQALAQVIKTQVK